MEFEQAPRRIDAFSLFSDGIERLVLNIAGKAVNDSFFNHMIEPIVRSTMAGMDHGLSTALSKYLSSPSVNARTTDDKSLILATRRVRSCEGRSQWQFSSIAAWRSAWAPFWGKEAKARSTSFERPASRSQDLSRTDVAAAHGEACRDDSGKNGVPEFIDGLA